MLWHQGLHPRPRDFDIDATISLQLPVSEPISSLGRTQWFSIIGSDPKLHSPWHQTPRTGASPCSPVSRGRIKTLCRLRNVHFWPQQQWKSVLVSMLCYLCSQRRASYSVLCPSCFAPLRIVLHISYQIVIHAGCLEFTICSMSITCWGVFSHLSMQEAVTKIRKHVRILGDSSVARCYSNHLWIKFR